MSRPPPLVAMPSAAFFVVLRWWYFFGLGGLAALVVGGGDLVVALGSSLAPVAADLEALERYGRPDERFLRIGEHVALLDQAVVFRREGAPRASGAVWPPATIDHVLYPIASLHHPYVAAWQELDARYPTRADVPLGKVPPAVGLHVFVRAPALPPDPGGSKLVRRSQLVGLVRPWTIVTAKVDERAALANSMPDLDLDSVVILDADMRPPSLESAVALLGIGLLLLATALYLYRRRRRRRPAAPRKVASR